MKKILLSAVTMFAVSCAGYKWSPILPNKYANCVSKKTSQGAPIVVSRETMSRKEAYPDGYVDKVECEKDPNGFLMGTSPDGKEIIFSDATQACVSMQGKLPTQSDYQSVTNMHAFPNVSDNIFWTTTVHSNASGNLGIVYKGNYGDTSGGEDRSRLFYVRCLVPKK